MRTLAELKDKLAVRDSLLVEQVAGLAYSDMPALVLALEMACATLGRPGIFPEIVAEQFLTAAREALAERRVIK